jgi:Zn-dependent protease
MISFTARELRDIAISMSVIAVIFAYLFSSGNIQQFELFLPVAFVAVGFGFVLHELAHKFVAVRYGFYAEFKMWVEGLIFALVTTFLFGFVFVAPGAVYIHGEYISTKENGIISIAGPLVNIVLAIVFLVLIPFTVSSPTDFWSYEIRNIVLFGFIINSYLAAFNLIPVLMFDGAKIIKWNPIIWGVAALVAVVLTVKAMFSIY